jgi:hypothetical protein
MAGYGTLIGRCERLFNATSSTFNIGERNGQIDPKRTFALRVPGSSASAPPYRIYSDRLADFPIFHDSVFR